MKQLLLVLTFCAAYTYSIAQSSFKGKIVDARTNAVLAGATISSNALGSTQSDESGIFTLNNIKPGTYSFSITNVGYKTIDSMMTIASQELVTIRLLRLDLFLQPIEVRALRAGEKAPFTKTNLSKKMIEQTNLGQDLPFILNQTPSVVINSDAGNGVGYTGIYIRGTDATRINMTLNGIPYNDAESQSIYFVDLPDFASSVNSIQVQRGVGTSSNGAGAFGATINFSTNEFHEKPYAEINNSFGSFNTWKNTVKIGSGLIADHFTLDARLSRISSDGFIDRASSNLKSFYLSAAYLTKNTSLRFNLISGNEKTYQAWNGIPESKVRGDQAALDAHYQNNIGSLYFTTQDSVNLFSANNRTYNYFTYKNQTDNYQQDHYQLFLNHQFNDFLSLNIAGFLTRGKGYYEEFKSQQAYSDYGLPDPVIGQDTISSTDLIRQKWLDNYFYGGIFSFQYRKAGTELTLGGGWNRYDGQHYGDIIWAENGGVSKDAQYYNSPAHKTDFNVYAKWQQAIALHWNLFADMQYRQVGYRIEGFDDNPAVQVNQTDHFFNPKAGISYSNHEWMGYFSYSQASHEPNRNDFEAGIQELPKSETLRDFELGISKKNTEYNWGITAYYMRYKNQLVLTGKINDVGAYTRTNIPESYRMGIELEAGLKPADWFSVNANLALSENKVLNFTEYIDDYDNGGQKKNMYKKTDISFSPNIVAAGSINFFPVRNFEISLPAKYVGKSYLDNTQNDARSLNAYYVQNLRLIYTIQCKSIHEVNLILQLNNLFDKKYEPNGYTYSYLYGGQLITENFLFPMAGTNFMMAVNIKL